MFLRRCHRRKNGKQHLYWLWWNQSAPPQVRVSAWSPIWRTDRREQNGWAIWGNICKKISVPSRHYFDPPHYDEPDEKEQILVKLKDIKFERLRDFGDVWLAYGLWRLFGLDSVLAECLPPAAKHTLAAGRPDTYDRAFLRAVQRASHRRPLVLKTALKTCWAYPPDLIHTDRLYAAMDHILPCKDAIGETSPKTGAELFNIKYIFYSTMLPARILKVSVRAILWPSGATHEITVPMPSGLHWSCG